MTKMYKQFGHVTWYYNATNETCYIDDLLMNGAFNQQMTTYLFLRKFLDIMQYAKAAHNLGSQKMNSS